ncbi:short chain dehydrogenase [Legionella massiliensis]|uniref:Short chain dehydrogenase n=1 Tax=Legionella massiliensis TaxID=1034943 RepID=A0A078L446_9GAMM|nr:short chain dehydrogenase [Legionella massiliensis]CDZ78718.1 short chain dehydrogenase [Legionella massiliensis]CEE14456.1 short chain dehydrogenase [Legionella massiliensis]
MRIIVIGATGTIGQAVVRELQCRHEIIKAGLTTGDVNVDITNQDSVEVMFKKAGQIDAVILTTGRVHFGDFLQMHDKEYQVGLQDKLMGQINTVLIGRNYLNEGGSFTLTSGILSEDPIRYGSAASMVNGALNAFVGAAAIEMPKRLRINCVSPTVLTESMDNYADYFRGFESVSADRVALAYSKSVEGMQTGKVYKVL